MTFKQSIIPLCLSVSILAMTGCGSGDPRHRNLVPASGVILYNGEPIEGASVTFHHEDTSKQGGSAISEANGVFTLRTYGGPGTYPGTYIVTASKVTVTYPISDEELNRRELEGLPVPAPTTEWLLPLKYRDKATSGIQIVIPPGGDRNLRIELSN